MNTSRRAISKAPVFATLDVEASQPLTYDYPSLYDPARRQAFKAAWQPKG